MDMNKIKNLLINTQYEPLIDYVEKITLKNFVYDNLYRIGNSESGYYAIKIRKKDQMNALDSIKNLKMITDKENIMHKNIDVMEKEDVIITISDWLEGKQPIDNYRNTLPEFFSKLALFNLENISNGPYTSMYLDCKYFNSVDELIDYEVNYHKKYIIESINFEPISETLEILKKGVPCIINEDMNCGNLFITKDGKYKIIDTEWIINGINLYQFQHFDYFGFDSREWYKITDEAKECYRAYFETLGISHAEANEQTRAIELLNTLRSNTYWKCTGNDNDREFETRIKIIMENKNPLYKKVESRK